MNPKFTHIGQVSFRTRKDAFGIYTKDRQRHMLILGQTGVGKTTLIKTMARSDFENGHGVMIIDPHGDLSEELLALVPKHRKNDVVYFNPADSEHCPSFNLLAEKITKDNSVIVSAIILAFQKTWGNILFGPRSEHLLRMALLALVEFPGMSLLDLLRFYGDKEWRFKISSKVKDEVVRRFWTEEFAELPDRLVAESLSPLQNKLGALVGNPILRRILGTARTRVKIKSVIDNNKILLVNLSRGQIGLDGCVLLGSMMMSMFEAAILSRAEIQEEKRTPFFLTIDEFSLFASPGFISLLAEGRKYGLGITLAQQSIVSLSQTMQSDMLTNCGTLVCFRVGAMDSKLMAEQLFPVYEQTDLMNMPAYEFAIRLLINGRPSVPFSGRTILT